MINTKNIEEPAYLIIKGGIDEVGRGPLYGPMMITGVANPYNYHNPSIKDSKKYKDRKASTAHSQRSGLVEVMSPSLISSTCTITPKQIDGDGMSPSMKRAHTEILLSLVTQLAIQLQQHFHLTVVIDGSGFDCPQYSGEWIVGNGKVVKYKVTCIQQPKADDTVFECSAASVIAKVLHDNDITMEIATNPHLWPYKLGDNMGYYSDAHVKALAQYGPAEGHRKSFVKTALENYHRKNNGTTNI